MKAFVIFASLIISTKGFGQQIPTRGLLGNIQAPSKIGNGSVQPGSKIPAGQSTPFLEGIDDKEVKIGIGSSLPHVTPGGALGYWGVGNGGDSLRIGFARARDYAANVVLRIKPNSLGNIKDPSIRDWILQNQAFLAADILQSEHVWTLEDRPTCAWTVQAGEGVRLPVSHPVQFSYPACRKSADSFLKAAQVLIHESVHHFNGDETTADKIAIGIIDAWQSGNMDAVPLSLNNAPQGTERHSSVWTGKEMVVIGGLDNATQSSVASIRVYDPRFDSWKSIPVPPELGARHDALLVWTGSEVLIWGGFRRSGVTTEWLYSGGLLNPETGVFRSLRGPDFWTPKAFTWEWDTRQTLIWTGKKAIVWGGFDSKLNTPLGAILEFHDKTQGEKILAQPVWSRMNVSSEWAPERIAGHSAIWTGEKMVIWGGYNGRSDLGRGITNTGAIYDAANDTWEPTLGTGAPAARSGHQAIWTGSKMIVISGAGVSTPLDLRSTGGQYDIEKGIWTSYTNELLVERTGHKAVWNGEEVLLVGGRSARFRTYFGEIFAYNPGTNRWRILGSSIQPIGRSNPSIVWTGSSAIIWGGQSGDQRSEKTGAIYYP